MRNQELYYYYKIKSSDVSKLIGIDYIGGGNSVIVPVDICDNKEDFKVISNFLLNGTINSKLKKFEMLGTTIKSKIENIEEPTNGWTDITDLIISFKTKENQKR